MMNCSMNPDMDPEKLKPGKISVFLILNLAERGNHRGNRVQPLFPLKQKPGRQFHVQNNQGYQKEKGLKAG